MGISAGLGSSALLPGGLGFRNALINSDFRINQRAYTSASNLASGAYGFDRWKSTFTNTTLTFTSAPQGQMVTINSGGSIEQVIERENIAAGTYILSWEGTATGRVYNVGATAPAYSSSPLTVVLDGLANVEVEFTASGGTRTLWRPQLERNFQATSFENRPIGVELSMCQRYYYRTGGLVEGDIYVSGYQPASTAVISTFFHPVRMRATPSLAQRVGTWLLINSPSQPILSGVSQTSYHIFCNVNASISNANQSGVYTRGDGTTYIEMSAEL